VESEAREDIRAGCRDGYTLVYKSTYNQFVCVPPSTAERWVELGLAEIISESEQVEKEESTQTTSQYEPAPPPPPPPERTTSIDDSTGCREGYTLVFRFVHHDTFCTSPSTAESWERLGLAEIVVHKSEIIEVGEEKIIEENDLESQNESVDEKPASELESINREKTSLSSYSDSSSILPEIYTTSEFSPPPTVYQINERIVVAVGYDTVNSIMIEGDKGLIIVDTLSTYENAKKVLKEFREFTDKPVKIIIYTHGKFDHVQGTKAFLEEGDGNVKIIAHDSLLDFYINENDVQSQSLTFDAPTETFSSEISLDISGVKMEVVHVGGESSDQIYVWLPDDEVLITGDVFDGIFPNIYTLNGNVYRTPGDYLAALDHMILLESQYLIPSHVYPVSGENSILNLLTPARDVTQYILNAPSPFNPEEPSN